MNKLNKELRGISNIKELEAARERIHFKMGLKELDLQRDMEEVKEALTFSNICRTVWNSMDISSFVSGLSGGYGIISSLFARRRKKHSCSM